MTPVRNGIRSSGTSLSAAFAAGVAMLVLGLLERAQPGLRGVLPSLAAVSRPGLVLGGMLAALAGVLISLLLPSRPGRLMLMTGASAFFGCLAYAILTGVRF